MPCLHLIRNTLTNTRAALDALNRLAPIDRLLLIENGIYSSINSAPAAILLADFADKVAGIYILAPDAQARGVQAEDIISQGKCIDYKGFVELTLLSDRIVTW